MPLASRKHGCTPPAMVKPLTGFGEFVGATAGVGLPPVAATLEPLGIPASHGHAAAASEPLTIFPRDAIETEVRSIVRCPITEAKRVGTPVFRDDVRRAVTRIASADVRSSPVRT